MIFTLSSLFTSRSAEVKYIVCKGYRGISTQDLKNLYEIVDELSIISKNKFPDKNY